MNLTSKYLNEVVLYGGIPVRRACMIRHMDYLGITGPARMAAGRMPVVSSEPWERWNSEEEKWEATVTGWDAERKRWTEVNQKK